MRKSLLVSLLLLAVSLCANTAWAQRTVTGKVTSAEDGNGIPGASVVVKSTSRGATTDAEGNYSVAVPADGGQLVFSFVGTTTQTVQVGNQSIINIALAADTRQLSEVVVTGVGVATTKAKLGFDVVSVSSKDLPVLPTASIDQALVGKIAGAQIVSASGTPGARANILLRGINTVNRGTAPMILMDGVQVGATDLNTLDPNSIERVEVVQGAASSTLYGAQGANGVIQLFSKRGQDGPIRVSFSTGYAENTYLNIGNVRKADKHAFATDASNNVIGASGKPISLDPATSQWSENVQYSALDPNSNANKAYDQNLKFYDHYAMFFKPSQTVNNSVNVSGGNAKSDFSVTLSNNYQTSTLKNNGDFNRTNLSTNIGVTLAKNLTLRSVTQFAYTRNRLKTNDRTVIYALNNTRPFADYEYTDPDGNYATYYGSASGVNAQNPNYALQYRNRQDNKVDLVQSLTLTYKPVKFLELNARYGLNYQNEGNRYIIQNQSQNRNYIYDNTRYESINAPDGSGEISDFNSSTVFQNAFTSATFRTNFQDDFKINLPIRTSTLVGLDYRKSVLSEYNVYGSNLPLYSPVTAAQAGTYRVLKDDVTPFITYGYLFSQNIEYGDFGGLTATYRTDYSSAFGQGSTPFGFPAGNAYVRPSSFNFWQNSTLGRFLPEFKLRAAYGQAGIQPRPFDRYPTLSTQTLGTNNVFYYGSTVNNPNLNVEVSRELELGTDMSIKGSNGDWFRRIDASFSYWKRNTDNAIYAVDVAPSSGVGKLKDNSFSLESSGLQFSLNTSLYRGKDFSWDFITNFTKQTSMITAVKGNAEVTVTSSAGSTGYVLKAGEKIGQLFGFIAIRDLNQILPDGTPAISEANKNQFEVASNGYVVYKNPIGPDGKPNGKYKQPLFSAGKYSFGDPNPTFNVSFINTVAFRDYVTLGFQFDWTQGSHVYNQTKSWMYRDGISSDYTEPITINGTTGAWTAFYRGVYQAGANNGTKNYFYEDASFVRLRNVSLRFNVNKMLPKLPFRNLQLELSGRNLLTWTKYTGYDPEISSAQTQGTSSDGSGENSAFDRGIDHNTLPNLRSYQVGLNFGF